MEPMNGLDIVAAVCLFIVAGCLSMAAYATWKFDRCSIKRSVKEDED